MDSHPRGEGEAEITVAGNADGFKKRMGDIARDINRTLDVEGVCRSFAHRLEDVLAVQGDRLLRGNDST